MSVRFSEANDRISYSGAGLPNLASGFTLVMWAYLSVDRNDFSTLSRFSITGNTLATFSTDNNGTDGPGYFTAGGSVISPVDMVPGEWRAVALGRLGDNGFVYSTTDLEIAATETTGIVSGVSDPDMLTFGGRSVSDATEWFDGRLAQVRLFNSLLTQEQIEAEWASLEPIVSPLAWWPLEVASDLTDHSGNGFDLSPGTSPVTTEDDPPIPTTTPEITGSLGLELEMTGSLAQAPVVIGSLDLELDLNGTLDQAPMIQGLLDLDLSLGGTLEQIAQITGNLDILLEMEGVLEPIPELVGALNLDIGIGGQIAQPPGDSPWYISLQGQEPNMSLRGKEPNMDLRGQTIYLEVEE